MTKKLLAAFLSMTLLTPMQFFSLIKAETQSTETFLKPHEETLADFDNSANADFGAASVNVTSDTDISEITTTGIEAKVASLKAQFEKQSALIKTEDPTYDFDGSDKLPVLIKLQSTPARERLTASLVQPGAEKNYTFLLNEAERQHERVLQAATGAQLNYKLGEQVYVIDNFIAAEIASAEVEKWLSLPEVADIQANLPYIVAATEIKQQGKTRKARSLADTGANYDWQSLKGQGRVIAIIDTGFDIKHKDMRITDASAAKYPDEASIKNKIAALQAVGHELKGTWGNEKFPYIYNYAKRNNDVYQGGTSHGMHVAGIAAANGTLTPGQAPEAQLLGLAVFAADGTTDESLYITAIEHAILLGADTVNMSLGKDYGVAMNMDSSIIKAIEQAKKMGIVMSIAGGNSNYANSALTKPDAANPNYAVVGDPAVAADSLAVASLEAENYYSVTLDLISAADSSAKVNDVVYIDHSENKQLEALAEQGKELIYVGLGRLPGYGKDKDGKEVNVDDYGDKNVTGKAVLIKRGEVSFDDKVKAAAKKGAAMAIIFNNEGQDESLRMSINDHSIPVVSITQRAGESMLEVLNRDAEAQVFIHTAQKLIPNPQGGQMSDFSSWGPSLEFDLKPEITAYGGKIYNLQPENTYGLMSGTSMAAPQVAGMVAKLKERLAVDKRLPQLEGEELYYFIKNVLMSTAEPVKYDDVNLWSPRKQGAGLMREQAALTTMAYAVGDEKVAKINKKNLQFPFFTLDGALHNLYSDKTLTFTPEVIVQTDVSDDEGLIKPGAVKVLHRQTFAPLTIPAADSVPFSLQLNLYAALQEVLDAFPNGNFVEGFILFHGAAENPAEQCDLVLPWISFYGRDGDYGGRTGYGDLPLFEKSVYDFGTFSSESKQTERPKFYTDAGVFNNVFTALLSDKRQDNMQAEVILGEIVTGDASRSFDMNKIAISPNGDGNLDYLALRAVFNNYFTEDTFCIMNEDEEVVYAAKPNYTLEAANKLQRYGMPNILQPDNAGISFKYAATALASWSWLGKGHPDWSEEDTAAGTSANLSTLPDGQYYLYFAAANYLHHESVQELTLPVIVDTVNPQLQNAAYADGNYKVTVSDERSGIKIAKLIDTTDKEAKEIILPIAADGSVSTALSRADLSRYDILIEDFAGNVYQENLELTLLSNDEVGRLEYAFRDENGKTLYVDDEHYTLEVKDKNSGVVRTNLQRLPAGDYVAELKDLNLRYENTPAEKRVIEFTIRGGDKAEIIFTLKTKEIKTASIAVSFYPQPAELPETFAVVFVNKASGRKYYAKSIGANGYMVELDHGRYDITCEGLPLHYRMLPAEVADTEEDSELTYMLFILDEREVGSLQVTATYAADVTEAEKASVEFGCIHLESGEEAEFDESLLLTDMMPGDYGVYIKAKAADLYTDNEAKTVTIERGKRTEVKFHFERMPAQKAKVKIKSVNTAGATITADYTFINLQGEEVEPARDDTVKDVYELPYGRYTVIPKDYDEDYKPNREQAVVELNKANPQAELEFVYTAIDEIDKIGRLNFINSYSKYEQEIDNLFADGYQVKITNIKSGVVELHTYNPNDLFNGNMVKNLKFGRYLVEMLNVPESVLVKPLKQQVSVKSEGAWPDQAIFELSFVEHLYEGTDLQANIAAAFNKGELIVKYWQDNLQNGILPNDSLLSVDRSRTAKGERFDFVITRNKQDHTVTAPADYADNSAFDGSVIAVKPHIPASAKFDLVLPFISELASSEYTVKDEEGNIVPTVLLEDKRVMLQDRASLGPYYLELNSVATTSNTETSQTSAEPEESTVPEVTTTASEAASLITETTTTVPATTNTLTGISTKEQLVITFVPADNSGERVSLSANTVKTLRAVSKTGERQAEAGAAILLSVGMIALFTFIISKRKKEL